jgi:tetratricopeptide (TPR) repeat protein
LAVLLAAAEIAQRRSDQAPAVTLYEQALQLSRAAGDEGSTLTALTGLGTLALWSGNIEQAVSHLEPALVSAREAQDPYQLTAVLNMLAAARAAHGDHANSQTLLEESLEIGRAEGDDDCVAITYSNLAELNLIIGEPAVACEYASRGVELHRRSGTPANLAPALLNRGLAKIALDEIPASEADLREALSISRESGFVRITADIFDAFAVSAVSQGEHERAVRLAGAAAAIRAAANIEPIGSTTTLVEALSRARHALGEQDYEAARASGERMPPDETMALLLDVS